jgi:hypothetical protein
MRIATRAFLTLTLALTFALTAAAQGNKPTIGQVMIVVKDINSKAEIGTVRPGETIDLPAGTRVRLIMSALPTGNARGPLYPDTVFSDTSGGAVTIVRSNVDNSTADLVLNRTKNAGRVETIYYQINDTWVAEPLRKGSFKIRIDTSSVGSGYQNQTGGATVARSRAEQLTRTLYSAILLREPDSGAAGTIQAIETGGYDALVREAVNIANSPESQIRLYQEGTSADARLEALYRHLLGLSRSQVDAEQWTADYRRLSAGGIADVVNGMVTSERFRERIDLRY